MKIIQFMASDGFGGAEKVFVELSNSLAERHEVIALVIRDCCFVERFSDKVEVIKIAANPTRRNPFLLYEIFTILRNVQPDILHTHAAKGAELIAKANMFLKIPHLATKHNDRKGRIFNRLRYVSAVSEKGKGSVQLKNEGTVRVIYNGVAREHVEQARPDTQFTMVGVGRLDRIKGFDLLIRQLATLRFDWRLRIIGEGPQRKELEQLIAELDLGGKVRLDGFQEDIPQIMRDADLVVISSHQEGGPKVMIEALYYAPMLVSTPVGAVVEVLPDKFMSELDSLGEKIAEIYKGYDDFVRDFATVAEENRGKFDLDKVVTQYENYYHDILRS